MKPKTYLFIIPVFLIAAFGILRFCQSRPTGPVTAREFSSLTNAVRSVTTEKIVRVDQVDMAPGRMAVSTGSHHYLFERTRFGWHYVPSVAVNHDA
jgi:hypothetical protein